MRKTTISAISLAVVLVIGVMATSDIFATKGGTKSGNHSPDFQITSFGIDGSGNPSITVAGIAGATTPTDPGDVYAYVFFTDAGVFAVASHDFLDSAEQPGPAPDTTWHGHGGLALDANFCLILASLNDVGAAAGIGTSTVSITGTPATTIVVGPLGFSVATMVLTTTDEGNVCIKHVFDIA